MFFITQLPECAEKIVLIILLGTYNKNKKADAMIKCPWSVD